MEVEMMDRFTKYALLTMTIIVAILMVAAYVGTAVLGQEMGGTDATVNEKAGEGEPILPFTIGPLGENGEYLGFGMAGVVGGFIVGYMIPSIFGKSTSSRRED
jgi:ABC-type cobalt transport system substrate-binding protein